MCGCAVFSINYSKRICFQQIFNFGCFLSFDGCDMEGFVAIEDRPLVIKEIGPDGGRLTTDFDNRLEAAVSPGAIKRPTNVKMMVTTLYFAFLMSRIVCETALSRDRQKGTLLCYCVCERNNMCLYEA